MAVSSKLVISFAIMYRIIQFYIYILAELLYNASHSRRNAGQILLYGDLRCPTYLKSSQSCLEETPCGV